MAWACNGPRSKPAGLYNPVAGCPRGGLARGSFADPSMESQPLRMYHAQHQAWRQVGELTGDACRPRPAAKLVIISNNCPAVRKSELEYYAMLAKTGVHHYGGSGWPGAGLGHAACPAWSGCEASHDTCAGGEASRSLRVCRPADNVDLGTACGKYYRVSVLAITDPGALCGCVGVGAW